MSAIGATRAPDRDALRRHLVSARIAGDVATPRESNRANIDKLLSGEPEYTFGLELSGWDHDRVLAVLAARAGLSPDREHREGPDRIDPGLTVAALDAASARLAAVARPGGRVLLGSGHPSGILAIHLDVAAALARRGAVVLLPAAGRVLDLRWAGRPGEVRHREIRYVGGVATMSNRGALVHTHLAAPMEAMLGALEQAGEAPPDLVVGDHGFAGAAAQRGVPVIGFADSNDPALFVAADEGRVDVVVPLDDNVAPHLYAPVSAYLLRQLG